MPTDLISLADWPTESVNHVLNLAGDLKQKRNKREEFRPLRGKTLILIFEKPSLRTRITFETGAFQLGCLSIFVEDVLGKRESIPDVARNLERWVDGIIARTHSHDAIVELAEYSRVPVINALTDKLHPCQVLADAQTLIEHKGRLDGLKVAFVGDGNNMCASWANVTMHAAIDLTLACPEGYEVEKDIWDTALRRTKGTLKVVHRPEDAVRGADAVYTDVWASMGQESETETRKRVFAPFQVNAALMALAKPDAVFMHCLPAHRGEEVTNEVIESERSVVFDQAENRLHAQKAVMVELMA